MPQDLVEGLRLSQRHSVLNSVLVSVRFQCNFPAGNSMYISIRPVLPVPPGSLHLSPPLIPPADNRITQLLSRTLLSLVFFPSL